MKSFFVSADCFLSQPHLSMAQLSKGFCRLKGFLLSANLTLQPALNLLFSTFLLLLHWFSFWSELKMYHQASILLLPKVHQQVWGTPLQIFLAHSDLFSLPMIFSSLWTLWVVLLASFILNLLLHFSYFFFSLSLSPFLSGLYAIDELPLLTASVQWSLQVALVLSKLDETRVLISISKQVSHSVHF